MSKNVKMRFDSVGKLDSRTELGDGSVRFTARLTRIGVFSYDNHAELRTEEEVFSPESLASFRGLAVTEGHKAWISPDNWRDYSIGHVGDDVRRDGDYVIGDIVVKDRGALARIDAGVNREISMGYQVDLEDVPGVAENGEKYDSIQRNIRGNHAALGAENWGRAGTEVRLLDSPYTSHMTTPERRIDAPATPAANTDAADLQLRLDRMSAERDAAVSALASAKQDADPAKLEARISARVNLIDSAVSILGKDFTHAGKSDGAVRKEALRKVYPDVNFDSHSDAYVEARFDLAVEAVRSERKALSEVAVTVADAVQVEDGVSAVEAAQLAMIERNLNAWKGRK